MKMTAMLVLLLAAAACNRADNAADISTADRFERLDASGMSVSAGHGDCVADSRTGLTWEIKYDKPGLRNWRNTYSWFNPNEATNELDYRGLANGGSCAESACDTWSYVQAINAAGLCGHFDWRMPSRNELMSISDLSKAKNPPTIDLAYFPYTQAAEYWTGYDYSTQHESAWGWSFRFGHDRVDWKRTPKFVRLVRGQAEHLDKVKE